MITSFIIALFKLPKRIFNFLVDTAKKIKDTLIYLFVPEDKRKNKRK